MSRVFIVSVMGCCFVAAQTTKVDLQNQSRGVDFSAAPSTKPAKTGAALPSTCSTGEAFVLTTAVPGSNLFICTATNTWTLQGAPPLGFMPIDAATLGQANGPAKLGSDGKLPVSSLAVTPIDAATLGQANGPAKLGSDGKLPVSSLAVTPIDAATLGQANGPAKLGSDGKLPASLLDVTPIDAATLGQANGPAKLGSDGKVLSSELPASVGGQAAVAFSTDQVTGTGSQLAFTLSGTPLNGSLNVSLNGQLQEPGADYGLAGSTVTFSTASIPTNGARISFRYAISTGVGTANVSFATDQATGTGSQDGFTLASAPMDGSLTVAVNGQIQESGEQGDYTVSGSTVTFKTASIPASAARVSFRYGVATTGGGGTSGPITMAQLPAGTPNGLATLGSDGKVTASQLPASTGGSGSGPSIGAQTFTTAGTSNWTVPAGVTRVFVQVWGAGGGGDPGNWGAGPGGAGGGYAEHWCLVIPGATVPVIVGNGGLGGINGTRATTNGESSSFGACATATGGAFGTDHSRYGVGYDLSFGETGYFAAGNGVVAMIMMRAGWHDNSQVHTPLRADMGGIGGSGGGSNGDGIAGGGAMNGGGGGGGGANGSTQSGGIGGVSGVGGSGGSGASISAGVYSNCAAGTAPGGGGGGGAWNGNDTNSGCDGASGQVKIWW